MLSSSSIVRSGLLRRGSSIAAKDPQPSLIVSLRCLRRNVQQHGAQMKFKTICSFRQQSYSSSRLLKNNKPPMPRVLPGTTIPSTTKSASPTSIVGHPPMPRVLPGTNVASVSITPGSSASTAAAIEAAVVSAEAKSGSFLIKIGWLLLGLVALDQYLQYLEKEQLNEYFTTLHKEEILQRQRLLDEWKDAPTLYKAIVHMKYKGMGGTKGLRGVVVNDQLDVLQENVGPGQTYSLCRKQILPQQSSNDGNSDSKESIVAIGWYPTSFLTKIENQQTKAKRFWLF